MVRSYAKPSRLRALQPRVAARVCSAGLVLPAPPVPRLHEAPYGHQRDHVVRGTLSAKQRQDMGRPRLPYGANLLGNLLPNEPNDAKDRVITKAGHPGSSVDLELSFPFPFRM